ncbi:DUF1707 domain-containing protein [Streptomyces sp. NPDC005708]|uniref:DUF1707 SHOCT-like domain-containing protein n=1 Tax=Streptomyces sp. NPDC005708 TaxID=3154564 RepID=UPI0034031F88
MAGELSRAEEFAGSGVSLGLRASHADRDRVVDVLRIAAGDGRLTSEELDDRLEAALSARTVGELSVLTGDLPAVAGAAGEPAAPAKDFIRIEQQGSSARRDGGWVVPRRMEIRSSWGDVTLDLTQAVITQSALRIDLDMLGGSLVLMTRPGIVVDTDSLTVSYAKVRTQGAGGTGVPVSLRIELAGDIRYGRVVVRSPRRTFAQWLLRRPAARTSPTGC